MATHKKQYVIFGMGRFGAALAQTLCEMGHEVLAVDSSEDNIAAVMPHVTHGVSMDATDEEAFSQLGVRNFDAAVVAIGQSIRDSVLVSLMCKEAGVSYVMAKATDELHARVLRKVGVDRVVFPERDMGVRAARTLVNPHVLDLVNLPGDYTITDIQTPASWQGQTLLAIDVRKRYRVSVLAIRREGALMMSLTGDTVMQSGDGLLILGHKQDIERVEALE